MSKEQLQQRVLADPNVEIYECGRQDIESGAIDRRVLATLEFLVAERPKPTITSLHCGHGYYTTSGNVSEHSTGTAVDIAAVNGIPIAGHQGDGSITDITIRRLLTLQGTMKPHQIISLMTFPGTDNTLALPDHDDHIHVGFQPGRAAYCGGQQLQAILKPGQWTKLDRPPGTIPNPVVAQTPRSTRSRTAAATDAAACPRSPRGCSASCSSSSRGRSVRPTGATSCATRPASSRRTCSCWRRSALRSAGALRDRRPRAVGPEPPPTPVATARATVVDADAGAMPRPSAGSPPPARRRRRRRWPRSPRGPRAPARQRRPGRARAGARAGARVRAGYGVGEQVAEGRWTARARVTRARPRERRRTAGLRPQERLAALLGGHSQPLACEELALRARHDLDHGHLREGALQLRTALDVAVRELPSVAGSSADMATRIAELEELRAGTEALADAAIGGVLPPDGAEQLTHTLQRLESALRARIADNP